MPLFKVEHPDVLEKILRFIAEKGYQTIINCDYVVEKEDQLDILYPFEEYRPFIKQLEFLHSEPIKTKWALAGVLREIFLLKNTLAEKAYVLEGNKVPILFHFNFKNYDEYLSDMKRLYLKQVSTVADTALRLRMLNIRLAVKQYDIKSKGALFRHPAWTILIEEALCNDNYDALPLEGLEEFKSKMKLYYCEKLRDYLGGVLNFGQYITAEDILNEIIAVELEADSVSHLINRKLVPA